MSEGHKHADLMAQYAEDAKTSKTPWELWETRSRLTGHIWQTCSGQPSWNPDYQYRRKQIKIRIGDRDISPPLRSVKVLQRVYFPRLSPTLPHSEQWVWRGNEEEDRLLKAGLVFPTSGEAWDCGEALLAVLAKAVKGASHE